MNRNPPAIFLMGPTAAGKTALAMALCARFPLEVVSVDSTQIYRGMDIGTAKPAPAELARVPHRLLDIRDPAERYSAAEFRTDALRELADITRRGNVPLLVGGTMFYFRSLEQGLAHLPPADPAFRARVEAEAAIVGWPALHARLRALDPESAGRIGARDRQRIQRALEIHELTGRPVAALNTPAREGFPYRAVKLLVCPGDRAVLHERIAVRFEAMLEAGFLAEAECLYRRGDLHSELPSMRAVGYRQAWLYLSGKINYHDMNRMAIEATRQFAKRQLTWLRAETGLARLEGNGPGGIEEAVRCLARELSDKRL